MSESMCASMHAYMCVCFHVLPKPWVMSGNRVIWVIIQKPTQPNNETLMHTILMERMRQTKTYL